MKISLSRVHYPVTTLGPGRRLGIWLQGCSIRCPGCISSDTWAAKTPELEVCELVRGLGSWLQECEGVTISGGEPFDQSEALGELLRELRRSKDINVLVYSGRSLEELKGHPLVQDGLIDCLISDPFDSQATQTKYLRGSDNQRMSMLTARGRQVFEGLDRMAVDSDRRLDVMFDDRGEIWFAGIPSRGDMAKLQLILEREGTYLRTTEARA